MLVKWQPYGSLANSDSFIDDFFSSNFPAGNGVFNPHIDIAENEKGFLITAELPGLSKEDFKLTIENNYLTLEGEKKIENVEENRNSYRSERRYGSFKRSFRLNDSVDGKNIKADYKNGILTINVPKTEKASPKEIEVKIS